MVEGGGSPCSEVVGCLERQAFRGSCLLVLEARGPYCAERRLLLTLLARVAVLAKLGENEGSHAG